MPCDDCANLSGPGGIVRGDFSSPASAVMTSTRTTAASLNRYRFGARCARPD